jgi:hypothetical protein
MGRPAGVVPLRILSTKTAARRNISGGGERRHEDAEGEQDDESDSGTLHETSS